VSATGFFPSFNPWGCHITFVASPWILWEFIVFIMFIGGGGQFCMMFYKMRDFMFCKSRPMSLSFSFCIVESTLYY